MVYIFKKQEKGKGSIKRRVSGSSKDRIKQVKVVEMIL